MKVAVIGAGWVGSTLIRYFESNGHRVIVRDPPKGLNGPVEEADVCFVCVPTPFGPDGFDDSFVFGSVKAIPGSKTVVIKSTVLPGTTDKIQAANPQHRILFNPEFLRERAADDDFRRPDRQILGARQCDYEIAETVLGILPRSPCDAIIGTREAEMVKYFGNCYLAARITFGNQIYDLCKASGIDYETVKRLAESDRRIGPGYFEVDCDGYRGYGGTCFPKDMRALVQFGDAIGASQELLLTCEQINNRLRGEG